jgi:hypothetical protein
MDSTQIFAEISAEICVLPICGNLWKEASQFFVPSCINGSVKKYSFGKKSDLKKYLLAFCLLFAFKAGFTQQDSLPVYERFPTIPPFSIMRLPDSSKFTKADLKKKKATIIMIFSPDCEHCQRATEDLLAHAALFKNVQIVMATPLEYQFITPFYEHYKLAQQHNITVGRDATYMLGTFYQIHNFPSIYLYDKKGNYKEHFIGDVSFEKIATYL